MSIFIRRSNKLSHAYSVLVQPPSGAPRHLPPEGAGKDPHLAQPLVIVRHPLPPSGVNEVPAERQGTEG